MAYGKGKSGSSSGTTDPNATNSLGTKAQEEFAAKMFSKWEAEAEAITVGPWHEKTSTTVSKNGNYYIVPISVMAAPYPDEIIKPFLENGGTLKINQLLDPTQSHGVVQQFKLLAMKKLEEDLQKLDIVATAGEEDAMANTSIQRNASSFFVEPRPWQKIFIKVVFNKEWVDRLPDRKVPNIDWNSVTKTVGIEMRTWTSWIKRLRNLLTFLNASMQESGFIADVSLTCQRDRLETIEGPAGPLNELLVKNAKETITDTNPDYLQFGFTDGYKLVYVAHAPVNEAQCLCDQPYLEANVLSVGLKELASQPPFDSPTVNALIHYLPTMMLQYPEDSIQGTTNAMGVQIAPPASWLEFVNTYIYPRPTVANNPHDPLNRLGDQFSKMASSATDLFAKGTELSEITNSIWQKPQQVIPAEIRQRMLHTATNEYEFVGDAQFNKVLTEMWKVDDLESLYELLLNKVPLEDMVSLALGAVYSCLPIEDFQLTLCQDLITELSLDDILDVLTPCLREGGAAQQAEEIENALNEHTRGFYEGAKTLYPMDFTEENPTPEDLVRLSSLYCDDRRYRDMFDAPPEDFSAGFLAELAQDAAICKCIYDNFADMYKDIKEGIEDSYETIAGINPLDLTSGIGPAVASGLTSFDDMLDALEFPTTDYLKGMGEDFARGLKEAFEQVLLFAMREVLKKVRDTIMMSPDYLRDLCGTIEGISDPFSAANINDLIAKGAERDRGFEEVQGLLEEMFSKNNVVYTSGERLMEFMNDLGTFFTPAELRAILSVEPCSDDTNNNLFHMIGEVASTKYSNDFRFPNLSSMRGVMGGVGTLINPGHLNDLVSNQKKLKEQYLEICQNDQENICNHLKNVLSAEDCAAQLAQGSKDAADTAFDFFPLLDNKKLNELLPEVFCGPCRPGKIDTPPLMPSQFHESQIFLNNTVNNQLYGAVDTTFNDEIAGYKSIMLDVQDSIALLRSNSNDFLAAMSIKRDNYGNVEDGNGSLANYTSANFMKLFPQPGEPGVGYAANGLRTRISEIVGNTSNPVGQIQYESQDQLQIFSFSSTSPETKARLDFVILFNYTESDREYKTYIQPQISIPVPARTVKMVAIDYGINDVIIEKEVVDLGDTTLDGFSKMIFENVEPYFSKHSEGDKDQIHSILQQFLPLTLVNTLRRMLSEVLNQDLFLRERFENIRLTNEEIAACEGIPGLLNIDEITNNTAKNVAAFECLVNRNASPDAMQTANFMGTMELFVKIFVIEEYLRNIFAFATYKVGDIVKEEVYADYIFNNIHITLVRYGAEQWDDFKKYAFMLTQNMANDGDKINVTNADEAVRFFIRKVAEDVSNSLDKRVQLLDWDGELQAYNKIFKQEAAAGNETVFDTDNILRFLQYIAPFPPRNESGNPDGDGTAASLGMEAALNTDGNVIFTGGLNSLEVNQWPFVLQEYVDISSRFSLDNYAGNLFDKSLTDLQYEDNEVFENLQFFSESTEVWMKNPYNYRDNQWNIWFANNDHTPEQKDTVLASEYEYPPPGWYRMWKWEQLSIAARASEWNTFNNTMIQALIDTPEEFYSEDAINSQKDDGNKDENGNPTLSKHNFFKDKGFSTVLLRGQTLEGKLKSPSYYGYLSQHPDLQITYIERETGYTWQFIEGDFTQYIVPPPYGGPDYNDGLAWGGEYIGHFWTEKTFAPEVDTSDIDWGAATGVAADVLTDVLDEAKIPAYIINFIKSLPENTTIHPSLSERVKFFLLRPWNRFLVAPGETDYGPNPGFDDMNFVWDSKFLQNTFGLGTQAADFTHRGKMSVSAAREYYVGKVPYDLNYPAENLFLATTQQGMKEALDTTPYTEFFNPIKYGMRLCIAIPKPRSGQGANQDLINLYDSLRGLLGINNENFTPVEIYSLLEEKVLEWDPGLIQDASFILLPLIDKSVGEGIFGNEWKDLTPTLTDVFNGTGLLHTMLGTGDTPGAGLNILRDKAKTAIAKELAESALFRTFIPLKELTAMSAIFQRVILGEAYPQLTNLFPNSKKTVIDLFNYLSAAVNKDYQATYEEAGIFVEGTGAGDDDFISPEIIGQLTWTFLKMAAGGAATMTDPTWRTPWFLPGPLTPVGILAKVLNSLPNTTTEEALSAANAGPTGPEACAPPASSDSGEAPE